MFAYTDTLKSYICRNDENTRTNFFLQGAWPWVGWLTADDRVCGGFLLCERYFMTLASCVSSVNETTGEVEARPVNEVSIHPLQRWSAGTLCVRPVTM